MIEKQCINFGPIDSFSIDLEPILSPTTLQPDVRHSGYKRLQARMKPKSAQNEVRKMLAMKQIEILFCHTPPVQNHYF